MKPIVIYQGKYGATQQYAQWIADNLECRAFKSSELSGKLNSDNLIILGSSVYIGKLQLREWLKKNEYDMRNRILFLFIVCGTPADKKAQLEGYVNSSVPDSIRNKCHIFYLPGRLVYKKLSAMDKFLLRMGALLGDEKTKQSMLTDYDAVKPENLEPLLKEIKTVLKTSPVAEVV